jgi:DNA mismatch endonuclease Vsr
MERLLKSKLPNGAFAYSTPESSRLMGRIRGKGNKTTEQRFKMALARSGIRGWKLHAALKGKPDFFFPEERLAIFVDGCFWHGCASCGHMPKVHSDFWTAKILRNRQRDADVTAFLIGEGIFVMRFWEHDLRIALKQCVEVVQEKLRAARVSKC